MVRPPRAHNARLLLDAAREAGRVAAAHHSALAAVAEGVSAKEALGLRL